MTGSFIIGQWHVSPVDLTVRDSTQSHRLRPKDMAVLQELARCAPNVVSRSALIDSVWPRGFVDPAVLSNAVSRLRKVLDDGAQPVIETIPRQGYRILSMVRTVDVPQFPRWTHGSPYRGLQPFTIQHSEVFFGRKREVNAILNSLTHQSDAGRSFLLLLGPSGAGKTSLIQAGVIPALLNAKTPPLAANWHVEHLNTSSEQSLWRNLANALNQGAKTLLKQPLERKITALELQDSPNHALENMVQLLDVEREYPPNRILIVIDHLEQILVRHNNTSEIQEFFGLIHEVARLGSIWIIAGLRSDFYEEYNKIPALTALKKTTGQIDVSVPDAEQLGSIIREPALAAGIHFETNHERSLDNLLQATAMRQTDVLPMLQFTLEELYNRRTEDNALTFAAYESIGGIEGSLAQRAEQVFTALDSDAKNELTLVLNALVRLSRNQLARPARRFARLIDLASKPSRERLVNAFIQSRLFVTRLDGNHAEVSVVHEALFEHWQRARQLLIENRDLLMLHRQLGEASKTWARHNRSSEFLLGSGPLEESERLLHNPIIELNEQDLSFIEASRLKLHRASKLRRIAIASLAAFALTAVTAAGVAMVKRDDANREARRATQVTEFLVDLFELANPGQSRQTVPTAKQVLDLGAQHLAGQLNQQPQVRATLLHTMGRVYMKLGAYSQAEDLLKEAHKLRQEFDTPIVERIESLNVLGKLNYHKGNYKEAKALYEQASQFVSSNRLTETALHAETLNHQGENFAALADYENAIASHETAYELRKKLFGPNNEKTGSSLQNLAGALRRNGKLLQAEDFYRKALVIHEAAYGPDHHEVAVVLSNLGLLLTDTEQFSDAKPLLERALTIRRAIFGNTHPHTANSLHNLSALLFRMENFKQAEPIFRESLELHESLFGADHDSVAYGRNNLATLLLETNRSVEAQVLYGKAYDSLNRRLGESHPNTALIQSNLAKASLANGNSAQALVHAKHSVQVLEKNLPPDHWRLGVIKTTYGAALTANNKTDLAEKVLLQSLDLLSGSHGLEAKTTQRTIEQLIRLYAQTNNPEQQLVFRKKLVNTIE